MKGKLHSEEGVLVECWAREGRESGLGPEAGRRQAIGISRFEGGAKLGRSMRSPYKAGGECNFCGGGAY